MSVVSFHRERLNNRVQYVKWKQWLIGLSFINIVLLVAYLVLQIRFHDDIKRVGLYDSLLAKAEERLIVMEGDISIFQGITAMWTMVGDIQKYTESPKQVIYLSSSSSKENGYQAYRTK